MEAVLLDLLHRLEIIAEKHGEISDTEVQEVMNDVVFDGFLKPKPGYSLPVDFKMYTTAGNKLVLEALAWFLPAARKAAERGGLNTFQKRLAAFQNLEVCTETTNCYNDFFGWWDAKRFDDEGNPNNK